LRAWKRFKTNHSFWFLCALLLVCILGIADYLTGYEISFAFFYLAPVLIATWYAGRKYAFIVSLFAAVVWHFANSMAGEHYSYSFIPYWNAATRLGFFVVVTILLSRLRFSLENERERSRMDPLTGVFNIRAFEDIASTELKRASRNDKPITVAYLDLDDFKNLNDLHGHSVGDQVLKTVAQTILLNIRRSDAVARVGGDEFVVVLPETGVQGGKIVVEKLRALLCSEMQANHWKLGLSLGAVTFLAHPGTVQHMLETADLAMYKAKRNGKNQIEYVVISEPPNSSEYPQILQ
jgi:diguanylate cyclase (GGDEF)-like protein